MEQARKRAEIEADIEWLQKGKFKVPIDRVMIFADPAEKFYGTSGLIEVPETYQFDPQRGTVMMIGNAVTDEQLNGIDLGERVIFNAYGPTELTLVDHLGHQIKVLLVHPTSVYVGWPYGFGYLEKEGE